MLMRGGQKSAVQIAENRNERADRDKRRAVETEKCSGRIGERPLRRGESGQSSDGNYLDQNIQNGADSQCQK
jgi:hypothetical protein